MLEDLCEDCIQVFWLFEEEGGMPLCWWWLYWVGDVENDEGIEVLSVAIVSVGRSVHGNGENSVGTWV